MEEWGFWLTIYGGVFAFVATGNGVVGSILRKAASNKLVRDGHSLPLRTPFDAASTFFSWVGFVISLASLVVLASPSPGALTVLIAGLGVLLAFLIWSTVVFTNPARQASRTAALSGRDAH
jgi:hypothetical protein